MRSVKLFWLLVLAAALAACATPQGKGNKLDEAQYQWSAAIRWNDFEGAWTLVDPEYRKAHPMTQVDFDRYKRIQVAGYRDLAARMSPDGRAMREIQIEVIDRSDMSQRGGRYTETWRYDETAKAWWITSGLPDIAPAP